MKSGVRPLVQGYWARSEGRPRECPSWHPEHADQAWQDLWLDGWDEAETFKARERAEGRKKLTLEAIEKYHKRVAEERKKKSLR